MARRKAKPPAKPPEITDPVAVAFLEELKASAPPLPDDRMQLMRRLLPPVATSTEPAA